MNIVERVQDMEAEIIEMRRHFHLYPEVSMHEKETIAFVVNQLEELGIDVEIVPDGGVIGTLEGNRPGKTLILRSDLDALPIEEATHNLSKEKSVVSTRKGAAHLCGHDAHMAMLLGAAKILVEQHEVIQGKILFVFEQGEEMGGGIFNLLQRLVEIGADGVWGIHVKSNLQAGKISVDPGPRMAGIYPFHVEINGKGGHGSRPDLAKSPVDCFHAFYQKFQSMRLHDLNPFQPIAFSIGSIQAGSEDAANAIPETLTFRGTARFLHMEQGRAMEAMFKDALDQICAQYACHYRFLKKTMPMDMLVYNQEECSAIAETAISKTLGEDVLEHFPAWMASEPFSFYQKYFPGVFAFVGIENTAKGTGAEHHNMHFDVDEDVLTLGVVATVQYAIDFLRADMEVNFVPEKRSVATLFEEVGF